MKMLFNKRGVTIVEAILSIAIFAAIALPLFSVFVQSVKTDRKAYDVLNANYISQGYLEKLDVLTYPEILNGRPQNIKIGDYYLTAEVEPYGSVGSLFPGECSYLHIIMNANKSMLAVMPDGKSRLFTTVPSAISLSISAGGYSFTGGHTTITGSLEYGFCAMLVNAMKKPADVSTSISLGTDCKAAHYCPALHENDIMFTGSCETYVNIIDGKTSLIRVSASVYDPASKEVAESQACISVKNW